MSRYNLKKSEAELIIGKGYGKARNAILYYALKSKINYLLFWDDDEYPLATIRDKNKITWKKQPTILEHLKAIKDTDITCGHS